MSTLALLLAIGTCGVLANLVAEGVSKIGIRGALGAARTLVFGQVIVLALPGRLIN